MRDPVQFVEVNQFGEELSGMQQFAEDFDHQIFPMRNGRLYAFMRGKEVFGYADILHLPVAFPAFHPGRTRPRDVIAILEGFKSHCQLQNGGQGLIGVPSPEEKQRKNFPQDILEKIGFARMHRELFTLK